LEDEEDYAKEWGDDRTRQGDNDDLDDAPHTPELEERPMIQTTARPRRRDFTQDELGHAKH
jgi:hypothetical protein